VNPSYLLFFAFGIGIVAGLRTFTAPAAVAWATRLGWLRLVDSPLAFVSSTWAVILFSALAAFELIADLLPTTPKRTAPGPLAARFISGAFCGACVCSSANQSIVIGALLGGIGAVTGAFAGYELRKRLASGLKVKDMVIALPEDLVAAGLALLVLSR
jgi:uncharacterized membrane protein